MNLLIVDDNAVNRKVLRAQFESIGHTVIDACDGIAALGIVEREPVDGVVSDILMPNMDGYRLCLEIRKDPRHAQLPFILYTSTYNSASDRQLAVTVGADAYIGKPAPVAVIMDALYEAARRRREAPQQRGPQPEEAYVLSKYNDALVHKLEEKNSELHAALAALTTAHDKMLGMNRELEQRVKERTAELEDANRELQAFSYSVSHDLRAPLRAINGAAAALLSDYSAALPDEGRRYAEMVVQSTQRMSALIADLLTFSRTAREPIDKHHIDTGALVAGCLAEFRDEVRQRSVEVSLGTLPDCRGDPALLRQVFLNLLSNAFKYTRRSIRPRIEVGGERSGDETVVHIRDNGVGFDMRNLDKLFGVFQRLHRDEEFEGTGVGLAIVHRIVTRHGGRVWAESSPGRGATFHVALEAA